MPSPYVQRLATNYPLHTAIGHLVSKSELCLSAQDALQKSPNLDQGHSPLFCPVSSHCQARLEESTHRQETLPSPIQKMPIDIFQIIVFHTVSDRPKLSLLMSNQYPPFLLAQICHSWRATIISMADLWSTIIVHLPRHPGKLDHSPRGPFSQPFVASKLNHDAKIARWESTMERKGRLIAEWIRRSRECPLNVTIAGCTEFPDIGNTGSLARAVFTPVVKSADRWRTLKIMGGGNRYSRPTRLIHPLALPPGSTFSSLQHLEVHSSTIISDETTSITNHPLLATPLVYTCSHLTSLYLEGRTEDILSFGVNWPQLTRLTLSGPNCDSTPSLLYQILQQCPKLVECTLNLRYSVPTILPFRPPGIVIFNSLETLTITQSSPFEGFFSGFEFHSLRSLVYSLDIQPGWKHSSDALVELLAACPHLQSLACDVDLKTFSRSQLVKFVRSRTKNPTSYGVTRLEALNVIFVGNNNPEVDGVIQELESLVGSIGSLLTL